MEVCICCQAEDGWHQLGLCQDCFDECKEEADAHNCTVESYWKIKPKGELVMSKNENLLEACKSLINMLSEDINDYPDSGAYRQVMDGISRVKAAIEKAKGAE